METHEILIEKYNNGISITQLAKDNNIGPYQMKTKLMSLGVKIRSRNEQNKYNPQNQRKFQEMFNGMLPVCFSQEVLLYQIPDIKFYLQSDNRIRFHYFYILVKCVLIL